MNHEEALMTMASDHITELRDGMTKAREALALATAELERLRKIENAAMRVASSRRHNSKIPVGAIVIDQGALDRLDAALEGREHICSCGLRINAEQTDGQF